MRLRRGSQLKRGALYTANPLLPDPPDQRVGCRDCVCPPRDTRAAAKIESGLCRPSAWTRKKPSHGERWRSVTAFIAPPSCYAPARQAWGASHLANAAETSAPEPCSVRTDRARGRFSLRVPWKLHFTRLQRKFRKTSVTRRNVNLPNQIRL